MKQVPVDDMEVMVEEELTEESTDDETPPEFEQGDRVRLTLGPHKGEEGHVVRTQVHHRRGQEDEVEVIVQWGENRHRMGVTEFQVLNSRELEKVTGIPTGFGLDDVPPQETLQAERCVVETTEERVFKFKKGDRVRLVSGYHRGVEGNVVLVQRRTELTSLSDEEEVMDVVVQWSEDGGGGRWRRGSEFEIVEPHLLEIVPEDEKVELPGACPVCGSRDWVETKVINSLEGLKVESPTSWNMSVKVLVLEMCLGCRIVRVKDDDEEEETVV